MRGFGFGGKGDRILAVLAVQTFLHFVGKLNTKEIKGSHICSIVAAEPENPKSPGSANFCSNYSHKQMDSVDIKSSKI